MSEVVPIRRFKNDPMKRAELWEGIVRFMEANGKREFCIGLNDAKEIAAVMRDFASRG